MTNHQFTYVFQSNMGGHHIEVTASDYQTAFKEIKDIITSPKLISSTETIKEVN